MGATVREFSVNGVEAKPRKERKAKGKRKKPKLVSSQGLGRARTCITLGMGCGIPALSLSLSHMGGELLAGESPVMGLGMLGLCGVVLAVSLSHLAWAIGDITRSPAWASWCLAVAIDATLVGCELASVSGYESWVASGVMACVTLASMVLNCWAFTQHD